MYCLLEAPKLITKDLDDQIKKISFWFNLYYKISKDEVIDIFRSFPFTLYVIPDQIKGLLDAFQHYGVGKDLVIKLCKESGGILAAKKSSVVGLFDFLYDYIGLESEVVFSILDKYPEFVLQSRHDLLVKKLKLITKNKDFGKHFIKELFIRHPDLFLK